MHCYFLSPELACVFICNNKKPKGIFLVTVNPFQSRGEMNNPESEEASLSLISLHTRTGEPLLYELIVQYSFELRHFS